jgi:uncharacterized YccA/Bax inhibitor family protein
MANAYQSNFCIIDMLMLLVYNVGMSLTSESFRRESIMWIASIPALGGVAFAYAAERAHDTGLETTGVLTMLASVAVIGAAGFMPPRQEAPETQQSEADTAEQFHIAP